jgi:DNA repair protein RadC
MTALPIPVLDLRERVLASGAQCLGDSDLLALLLGTGTRGRPVGVVAARLLVRAGGVEGLLRIGPHAFVAEEGLGMAKAARIAAGLELGRRAVVRSLAEQRLIVAGADAVAHWARPRLAMLEHEEVWLLSLDGRNGVKSSQRIAQGGLHGCALTARDVLRPALRDAASAIVLVHNHPSGDPTPSTEDIEMTRLVAMACEVVGVPLLDHVVVARGGAASLFELGVLAPSV